MRSVQAGFSMSIRLGLWALLPMLCWGESQPGMIINQEAAFGDDRCAVEIQLKDDVGGRTDYWGTDGQVPTRRVARISFTVNGTTWPCPPNAYQDMAEVAHDNQVSIEKGDAVGRFVLIVRGGDGGGAYTAAITITAKGTLSRTIEAGGGFVSEQAKWEEGILIERRFTNSYRTGK